MFDTVKWGLHVQVGNDVSSVKEDVSAFKDGMDLYKVSRALLVFTRLCKLSNVSYAETSAGSSAKNISSSPMLTTDHGRFCWKGSPGT